MNDQAIAIVRPEHIKVLSEKEAGETDNRYDAVVDDIVYFGPSLRLFVHVVGSEDKAFFDVFADTDLAGKVKREQRLKIGVAREFALCYGAE